MRIRYGTASIEVYSEDGTLIWNFYGEKGAGGKDPFIGEIFFGKEEAVEILFGLYGIEEVKVSGEGGRMRVFYDYELELLKITAVDDTRKSRYYINPPHHVFLLSEVKNFILSLREIEFVHGNYRVYIDRESELLVVSLGDETVMERNGEDFRSLRAVIENKIAMKKFSEIDKKLSRTIYFRNKYPSLALKIWSLL